ncbi:hypothetical protein KKF91_07815 [Myxococcota bacterium]|nr:hypothetical protein [Myxococcota bacterium]
MPLRTSLAYSPDDLGLDALRLVERLLDAGRADEAEPLLLAASRLAPGEPRLSAFIAEQALSGGDPERALEALIPAWERGDGGERIGWLLALTALALRLDDVVDGLVEGEAAEHQLIRLLRAAERGERVALDLDLVPREISWRLRTLLRWLVACGRADLLDALAGAGLTLPGLDEIIEGLRPARRAWAARLSLQHARAAFEAAWPSAPAGLFAWAWACAREVEPGAQTLLWGAGAAALAPLLGHADLTVMEIEDSAPLPSGRFEHIIAPLALSEGLTRGEGLTPTLTLTRLRRALRHGGQLVLCAAGPGLSARLIRFEQSAVQAATRSAGLIELGMAARRADGCPCAPEAADLLLLRATKSLF